MLGGILAHVLVGLMRGIILLLIFLGGSLLPALFIRLPIKLSVVNVLIHDVIAETPSSIMMLALVLMLMGVF